jgi:hypothetical protein
VKERENSDPKNSENPDQEENLTEITSPFESFTEVQSVEENLTSSHADSPQQVGIDQTASLHAAENTLVVSANQDDDDELSILMSNSKPNEIINHQSDDQTQSKKMTN